MKSLLVSVFVILALVRGAVPLSAHHSWPVSLSQLVTVKGTVKEAIGKATGDAKLKADGSADKVEGKVQNAIGGVKDTMRDALKK